MDIRITDGKVFKQEVAAASKATASKSLPVLGAIRISSENGVVALAGTDLEIGVRIKSESMTGTTDGAVCIPADSLKTLTVQDLTGARLVYRDESLTLQQGESIANLAHITADDFPNIPTSEDSQLLAKIRAKSVKAIKKVSQMATVNDAAWKTDYVQFVAEKGLHVISSNKKTMAQMKLIGNFECKPFAVSGKELGIAATITKADWEMRSDAENVFIIAGNMVICMRHAEPFTELIEFALKNQAIDTDPISLAPTLLKTGLNNAWAGYQIAKKDTNSRFRWGAAVWVEYNDTELLIAGGSKNEDEKRLDANMTTRIGTARGKTRRGTIDSKFVKLVAPMVKRESVPLAHYTVMSTELLSVKVEGMLVSTRFYTRPYNGE